MISSLDDSLVDNLRLAPSEDRVVDKLPVKMDDRKLVTKKLHKKGIAVTKERGSIEGVTELYQSAIKYSHPTAHIFHSAIFESAAVKVQLKRFCALGNKKTRSLCGLIF